ncbi:hypothetical protein JAAARDRAFT_149358 [Jaapia argillacea MUCL 33604]|uniref:Dihydroxyacetone kinase n=1 Tax=Jaapia argillacea MUCL 33604 TaxID=933084 RepID=A0A067QG51_9AGAM|nr:hypothetical protein JAAARDRAFT_149358 [Jaapia argillacea MUCL 33604]
MSSKHIFDSPQGLVLKSLRGAIALNPSLRLHAPSKSVYISPSPSTQGPKRRLAVISGGGAGHEPAHAGYTGQGMLSASVSGDIFASPSAKAVLTCIQLALLHLGDEGEKEVLVIINNYTGDRLNFGLAIEKARALIPGLSISSVVVSDDVSLLNSPTPSLIGARGLGGNILVCKILGAAAARGGSLDQVKALGEAVVKHFGSVGVGLGHCHVPGRTKPSETEGEIGEDECEIGMGLHNEPGARRCKLGSAEELVGEMINLILTSKEGGFGRFGGGGVGGDEVVLFVNNLGGISQLEMGAVVDETLIQLEKLDIHPLRVYSSSYMTSLNAPGFSLSLLNLSAISRELSGSGTFDILELLDDPTEATSWLGVRSNWPISSLSHLRPTNKSTRQDKTNELLPTSISLSIDSTTPAPASKSTSSWYESADISPEQVRRGIEGACSKVLEVESEMTRFDTVVGDGDCGETFAAGARAIQSALKEGTLDISHSNPEELVRSIGEILEDSMGGTIGALFALYFTSLSTSLSTGTPLTSAPLTALHALSTYTPAKPGDRTIIDALQPFCSSLASGTQEGGGLEGAVRAARRGAESTRGMKARLGRAVYVGGGERPDEEKDGALPPDPGAWGVAAIFEGFWEGLNAV